MDAQLGALFLSNVVWAGVAVAVHWNGRKTAEDVDVSIRNSKSSNKTEAKKPTAKVSFVTKTKKDQEKDLKDWQKKYEKVSAEREKAETELEMLQTKHEEWKRKIAKDKKKIQEKIKMSSEQVAKLKKETAELKAQQAAMHEKLRKETSSMEAGKDALTLAAQEAENSFKEATQHVNSVEKQTRILQKQADTLAKKQHDAELDIPRLTEQIEERTHEIEELEQINAELREELGLLLPDGQDVREYLDSKKKKGGKGAGKDKDADGDRKGGKGSKGGRKKGGKPRSNNTYRGKPHSGGEVAEEAPAVLPPAETHVEEQKEEEW
eukprot:TRINITY_DN9752_c0_g2_i1.p1 TRINITY_DN9752_c0_g2~~TRINITY_DN9752_c0_g2_i1.p1  ORF type:complete len:322 (+),score=102.34 TRINITY_DN9752_c0_g2_i1:50-1015(+)